jgi:hypothetical protein
MEPFTPFEQIQLQDLGIQWKAHCLAEIARLDPLTIQELRNIFQFEGKTDLEALQLVVKFLDHTDNASNELAVFHKKLRKLVNDVRTPVQHTLNILEKKLAWEEQCRMVASLPPERHQEARETVKRLLPALKPVGDKIVPGRDFFFIHQSLPDTDKELFCGPLTGQEAFITFDDTWTMANIFVAVGVFPSVTQARKNNAGGPIEKGFSHLERSKRQKIVTILNKFE